MQMSFAVADGVRSEAGSGNDSVGDCFVHSRLLGADGLPIYERQSLKGVPCDASQSAHPGMLGLCGLTL